MCRVISIIAEKSFKELLWHSQVFCPGTRYFFKPFHAYILCTISLYSSRGKLMMTKFVSSSMVRSGTSTWRGYLGGYSPVYISNFRKKLCIHVIYNFWNKRNKYSLTYTILLSSKLLVRELVLLVRVTPEVSWGCSEEDNTAELEGLLMRVFEELWWLDDNWRDEVIRSKLSGPGIGRATWEPWTTLIFSIPA